MAELNSVKVNCFISLPGEGFRTASAVPEQKLQIILKEIFFLNFYVGLWKSTLRSVIYWCQSLITGSVQAAA